MKLKKLSIRRIVSAQDLSLYLEIYFHTKYSRWCYIYYFREYDALSLIIQK